MTVSEQTQNQIMAVLRQAAEAITEKDLDGVTALLAPDFQFLSPGEKVFGWAEFHQHLKRNFSRMEAISLDFSDIHISAEGTVAWIMADLTCRVVAGGAPQTDSGRITAVLRGTGHAWVFSQVHISIMTT